MADSRNARTSEQMKNAPQGAVYIWANRDLEFPRSLATRLKRTDLKIVAPDWLKEGWTGTELTGIVVDHATHLKGQQWIHLRMAQKRVRSA